MVHNYGQATTTEVAAKKMALQLAQVQLDKAFVEARLEMLVDHVVTVLETTEWTADDNGVLTPAVAAEPLQALQSLVLSLG